MEGTCAQSNNGEVVIRRLGDFVGDEQVRISAGTGLSVHAPMSAGDVAESDLLGLHSSLLPPW